MTRNSVEVELVTRDPVSAAWSAGAYGGDTKTRMAVFADSPEAAREVAVEKVQAKWRRHQDLATYWIANAVHEDSS